MTRLGYSMISEVSDRIRNHRTFQIIKIPLVLEIRTHKSHFVQGVKYKCDHQVFHAFGEISQETLRKFLSQVDCLVSSANILIPFYKHHLYETSYLSHSDILIRKPIRSSKKLRIHPKFWSGEHFWKPFFSIRTKKFIQKLYQRISRVSNSLSGTIIDPRKKMSSGWLR